MYYLDVLRGRSPPGLPTSPTTFKLTPGLAQKGLVTSDEATLSTIVDW